jgi:hypothetical protein
MGRNIIRHIPVQRLLMAVTAVPEAVGPLVAGLHRQGRAPLRADLPPEYPCREVW